MLGEHNVFARCIACARRSDRQDRDDAIAIDHNRVVFKHPTMRFDGNDPARFDEEVDGNCVSHEFVIPANHARAARMGQNVTSRARYIRPSACRP